MVKPLEWYEVHQFLLLDEQVKREAATGSASAKLALAVLDDCRSDPEKWRSTQKLLKEFLDREAEKARKRNA